MRDQREQYELGDRVRYRLVEHPIVTLDLAGGIRGALEAADWANPSAGRNVIAAPLASDQAPRDDADHAEPEFALLSHRDQTPGQDSSIRHALAEPLRPRAKWP